MYFTSPKIYYEAVENKSQTILHKSSQSHTIGLGSMSFVMN